ncbi:hypothetical protein ACTFIT_009753, partial [Dictyostelium discoideum]
QTLP